MKLIPAFAVLAASVCLGQAAAPEPDTRKLAEDLLTLTHVDRSLADLRDQIGKMMAGQSEAAQLPEGAREKYLAFQQRLVDLIFEEMAFEKMKPTYLDIYSTVFNAEELAGLIEFYKSPTGRAYADKLPTVTKKMLEASQAKVQALAPRIQKLNEEFAEDLKKSVPTEAPKP